MISPAKDLFLLPCLELLAIVENRRDCQQHIDVSHADASRDGGPIHNYALYTVALSNQEHYLLRIVDHEVNRTAKQQRMLQQTSARHTRKIPSCAATGTSRRGRLTMFADLPSPDSGYGSELDGSVTKKRRKLCYKLQLPRLVGWRFSDPRAACRLGW